MIKPLYFLQTIVCDKFSLFLYDSSGIRPQLTNLSQDSSTISLSAPVMSSSTDISESLTKRSDHQVEHGELHRNFKKRNPGKDGKTATLSPGSAMSLRRSPRFKVSFICL